MAEVELIKPSVLYNILNQRTVFSSLSDPNYLLLIGDDCLVTLDLS